MPHFFVAREQAILEHLIGPRIGMGPEEAYFCSKFFNTLHAIEAPNFNRYGYSMICMGQRATRKE